MFHSREPWSLVGDTIVSVDGKAVCLVASVERDGALLQAAPDMLNLLREIKQRTDCGHSVLRLQTEIDSVVSLAQGLTRRS